MHATHYTGMRAFACSGTRTLIGFLLKSCESPLRGARSKGKINFKKKERLRGTSRQKREEGEKTLEEHEFEATVNSFFKRGTAAAQISALHALSVRRLFPRWCATTFNFAVYTSLRCCRFFFLCLSTSFLILLLLHNRSVDYHNSMSENLLEQEEERTKSSHSYAYS